MFRLLLRIAVLILLWYLVIQPSAKIMGRSSDGMTEVLGRAFWWMSAKNDHW